MLQGRGPYLHELDEGEEVEHGVVHVDGAHEPEQDRVVTVPTPHSKVTSPRHQGGKVVSPRQQGGKVGREYAHGSRVAWW